MNKACLQDQEVLARANNTFQSTAYDQGLTREKKSKKFFFRKKKIPSQEVLPPLRTRKLYRKKNITEKKTIFFQNNPIS